MDDFDGDLWGEDDIDEALLIEASQQVEAETINKVNIPKFPLEFNINRNISFIRNIWI